MHPVALFLAFALPCANTAKPPSNATAVPTARVMHLSLVNISGFSRQLYLKTGLLNLPVGQRVGIESHLGDSLRIVSGTNTKLHEQIVVRAGDDTRIIAVP